MKHKALLLAFAATVSAVPAFGQADNRDTGDIMNFLVQSQLVEFRPNITRDPFSVPSDTGNRNQGLLLIDEIVIKGKFVQRKKTYAIILDSQQNTLQISVGHLFQDGEVVQITDNSVVFNQWDASSSNRSGSRRVEKFFKRDEE